MNVRGKVGIATCQVLPEPDADEDLLLSALRERSIEPFLIAWDAPEESPGVRSSAGASIAVEELDLVVIRSTWNYLEAPDRFRAWLRDTAQRSELWNRAETCIENLDKHYLGTLEAAGIPIIPTWFVDRGSSFDLAARWADSDWEAIVIKPTISAGSFATRVFGRDQSEDARAFLAAGLGERDWLVQRYEPAVETNGERAIVLIDGEVSHAVRKSARFSGDDEEVSAAYAPTDRERAFAARVMEQVGEPTLYARVDTIEDAAGELLLAELELLEPSLFFVQCPEALDRFVSAIESRCAGSRER